MTEFVIALCMLIGGYAVYGALMERVIGINPKQPMPAYTKRDDVDYMPMSSWRAFLIQFLNIAGLGPIFGAIMGVMYGPSAFLWIVLGTIFAGGVHDFLSGVISIRMNGASLPEIVGSELGNGVKKAMLVFATLLLLLVTAVFIITPAGLLATMTPEWMNTTFWIIAIFAYYLLATLLPIDKLIGRLYPLFGLSLLFMALALLGVIFFGNVNLPLDFNGGLGTRFGGDSSLAHPVWPMMFVSIACGAISGFHATQSPMIARCLTNEKLARPVFYGAMVAEGVVALIWAAATIAFTGGYENLDSYMSAHGNNAGALVHDISFGWLGTIGGILAVLGVVAAPITTGDTALRSARLMVADFAKLNQRKIWGRLAITIPLCITVGAILMIDFSVLWRYFAWCNQTLATFTLWAVTVYLARHGKVYIVALLPAMLMTAVCLSYVLFAPRPEGLGLEHTLSTSIATGVALILCALFMRHRKQLKPHTND
ncbi:MAG: carbon starvation protein A [Paramuribaculum sp.]|nr:carbon starvation protein A [Paramuribaculum sp.]